MRSSIPLLTAFLGLTLASRTQPSEPYRVRDPFGAAYDALDAKHAQSHKDRTRLDMEREYGRPPSPGEQLYADLGRSPRVHEKGLDEGREHRCCGRPKERPVVDLDFGYNKGSKYDNGYGRLRAFDQTYDFGSLEELAAGLGHDPGYIWGPYGRKEVEPEAGEEEEAA